MGQMRKITAFVPADLLASAQAFTGEGVTETLKIALQKLAHAEACKRLLALKGSAPDWDVDLDALREDREFDEPGEGL